MITLDEAIERVQQGEAASTVLVDLQNTPFHERDTWVTSPKVGETDLLEMLVETGMIRLDPVTAAWVGPLVDHAVSLPDTDPLKNGFGVLLAYLQLDNRPLPVATKQDIAVLFNGMLSAMATLGVPQNVIDDYVDRMSGGIKYKDMTAQDLQEMSDQRAIDQADEAQAQLLAEATAKAKTLDDHFKSLWNTHVAPILGSPDPTTVTDAAMKDAILAIHSNWTNQL